MRQYSKSYFFFPSFHPKNKKRHKTHFQLNYKMESEQSVTWSKHTKQKGVLKTNKMNTIILTIIIIISINIIFTGIINNFSLDENSPSSAFLCVSERKRETCTE